MLTQLVRLLFKNGIPISVDNFWYMCVCFQRDAQVHFRLESSKFNGFVKQEVCNVEFAQSAVLYSSQSS